ncbi:MAG: YegP family protein [Thermoanaerobaculia bacterium]
MAGKFELKKTSDGQFQFHLKASNGQVILASERYKEKRGAVRGIESVKRNSPVTNRFERKTAKNGQTYFILRASNGRTIGSSETYTSPAALDGGIQSVQKNAPGASVDDQTA